ncbi:MAG: SGNH/GDSL hydrolase family protein [Phycisphaerales bacterium]
MLLGDSIFDNKVYVRDGPAVIDQLRKIIPDGWRATLLAVDGNTTADIAGQLERLPQDATHLVISVGGNDALRAESVLGRSVADVSQGLLAMADVRDTFEHDYRVMLDTVLAVGKPTTICTIYDPNFVNAIEQRAAVLALNAFNDVITRAASYRGLPIIDLRVVIDSPDDYANPIEPSAVGGEKLTRAILTVISGHDFTKPRCVLYGRPA